MFNTILKILIIFVFIFIGIEGWLLKETREEIVFENYTKPHIYTFRPTFNVIATCYTASPDETDDTPFITADGTDLRKTKDNVIAANWLPFGTRVEIDGKEYVVHDRMNKRYGKYHIDILVGSKREAMRCEQDKILEIIN